MKWRPFAVFHPVRPDCLATSVLKEHWMRNSMSGMDGLSKSWKSAAVWSSTYFVVAARHDYFGRLSIIQYWTLRQIQLPAIAHIMMVSVIGLVLCGPLRRINWHERVSWLARLQRVIIFLEYFKRWKEIDLDDLHQDCQLATGCPHSLIGFATDEAKKSVKWC